MNISIVQPLVGTVSETFIAAHASRLPAQVTVIHGTFSPHIGERSVLSQSIVRRAQRKAWRIINRKPWEWEITAAYLAAFRHAKAQAVLAEYGPTGALIMEACRLARIPLIVHFHGYDASITDVLKQHEAAYPLLFEQSAAIIAVSKTMERKLISLGAPARKVHYNPYGVDCKQFGGGNPEQSPQIFLTVGRFVEKKAPHLTLVAFAEVVRQCAEARLRMIGDGPLLGVCKDLVHALGIEEAVTFLGAQPNAVVQSEMRQARTFVQHSIEASNGDSEGMPVAILEACATGIPVISTRHAGIPDAVIEGETGLLVDERDVQGMAQHMLRLAKDPSFANQLGQAARTRIHAQFSMEKSIGRLWTIMEDCIKNGYAAH